MKTNNPYGADIMRESQMKQQQARMDFEKKFLLDEKYYTDERLIAGSKNAKDKVAVFSDPLCVACL
jgi:protein-disulfide isomerase